VVVAGEALVDLVPRGEALLPSPGGSPYNVALGLGRLGVPTAYLGPLSQDGFGRLLVDHLEAAGVGLDLAPRVTAPTTLAVVHLDADQRRHRDADQRRHRDADQRASYNFYLAATSAAAQTTDRLPALPAGAALHVSFGAIGVTHEPAGTALLHLLRREAGRRLTSLDPNVRISALDDLERCRDRLTRAVAVTDVVKVSDDDLALLFPDESTETIAARWADTGPALVVVTRGPDGAVGFGRTGRIEVPGRPVAVVDTVGAGDAFTAGLLAHLDDVGLASRRALDAADRRTVTAALERAVHVAALACTRTGADPPTAAELAGG
jgi:fructokinase